MNKLSYDILNIIYHKLNNKTKLNFMLINNKIYDMFYYILMELHIKYLKK